ncbi:MAG: hypothetical protein ACRDZ0_12725, partial [Acidimicrobiales bacterium]
MVLVPIDDPRDPRIAHFVGLRDRELARRVGSGEPGVFIAEGDIVAERAASAGYEPRAVLVDATRTVPLPPGVDAGVPVYAAAAAVLQRITGLGVHRGLLACFDRRPAGGGAGAGEQPHQPRCDHEVGRRPGHGRGAARSHLQRSA